MEKDEFLPIGTVIRLNGVSEKIMIVGYLPIIVDTKEKYDYSGTIWPVGLVNTKYTLVFNKDDIDNVIGMGFVDNEQKEFMNVIKKLDKQLKEEDKKDDKNSDFEIYNLDDIE